MTLWVFGFEDIEVKKGPNFKLLWFTTPISNSIYYFEVYSWPGSYFCDRPSGPTKKHNSQISPVVIDFFLKFFFQNHRPHPQAGIYFSMD